MKERPILFNGEMVNAILEGRKTQTRRIIKGVGNDNWLKGANNHVVHATDCCPMGQIGDALWVRETVSVLAASAGGDWSTESGCDYEFGGAQVKYSADGETKIFSELGVNDNDVDEGFQAVRMANKKSVPSIHMPRWASRIKLEITDIRAEQLMAISTKDAIAEGIKELQGGAKTEFMNLWRSVYGDDSWNENPWVWVIEFKVI